MEEMHDLFIRIGRPFGVVLTLFSFPVPSTSSGRQQLTKHILNIIAPVHLSRVHWEKNNEKIELFDGPSHSSDSGCMW